MERLTEDEFSHKESQFYQCLLDYYGGTSYTAELALERLAIHIQGAALSERAFDLLRPLITKVIRRGLPAADLMILGQGTGNQGYNRIMRRVRNSVNRLRAYCYGKKEILVHN